MLSDTRGFAHDVVWCLQVVRAAHIMQVVESVFRAHCPKGVIRQVEVKTHTSHEERASRAFNCFTTYKKEPISTDVVMQSTIKRKALLQARV